MPVLQSYPLGIPGALVDPAELPEGQEGTDFASAPAPQDPTAALATLLSGAGPSAPGPAPDISRSAARTAALARMLGIDPGEVARGEISQADLENTSQEFGRESAARAQAASQLKQEEAAVAPTIEGRNQLANTQAQGENQLANTQLQGQNQLATEGVKAGATLGAAQLKAGAGQLDPATVSNLASNILRSNNLQLLSSIPQADRAAVLQAITAQGGDINAITNQSRQMGETAHTLLDPKLNPLNDGGSVLDSVGAAAEQLESKGHFGILSSPLRNFMTQHGMSSLAYTPEEATEVANFNTRLGLVQKEVQRALAGARGAGASSLNDQFQKLINAKGDIQTFRGQLEALKNMLSPYATMAGYAPPATGGNMPAPAPPPGAVVDQ